MDASSSSSQNEVDFIEQEYGNLKRQYRIMEGDRNAYQQKAQHHISRQQRLIDRLRQEEEDLTTNLLLAQSNAVSKKDMSNLTEIRNLSSAQRLYQEVVGNERNEVVQLKRQIEKLEAEIYQQTQANGSAISQHENHVGRLKKIRVLENRHNTSTVQYNKLLTENMKLRENIEHFRNQRKVFNTLYKRLTSKLSQQKAQIGTVIDSATCHYDQRDESLTKMISLRERNDQDLNHFVSEYKEMDRIIAHESRLQEFMNTKNNELSALAMALENERSCGRARKAEHVQEEEMVKFEKVLNAIVRVVGAEQGKKLTGVLGGVNNDKVNELCHAIQPVCERYRKTEEQNYSLFQFVNNVNQDVKRLEEKIKTVKANAQLEHASFTKEKASTNAHVGEIAACLTRHTKMANNMRSDTTNNRNDFGQLQEQIVKLFKALHCENGSIKSMLSSSTDEVHSQTIDIYLSIIENRINELMRFHGLQEAAQEASAKAADGQRQKTPASRQSHRPGRETLPSDKGADKKKTLKSDTQNLAASYEYMDNNFSDLENGLLASGTLRARAQEILTDRARVTVATPKTPKSASKGTRDR